MNDGVIEVDDSLKPQSRSFFKPRSWLSKIDFINHLVLFNNLIITVLSEKEGGKTCFSALLQHHLDRHIKSVSLTIKVPFDRQQLMQTVATQLHLNHDKNTDFSSIVAQVNERKAQVLLIIDDAQYLPEDLIQDALYAIKDQGNCGFFHLCFIADYSVVATLNQLVIEPLKHLVHTLELGSLSESETRTYVLQRAMQANLINKPLTDLQFKRIYQLTKGNLSIINSQLLSFISDSPTKKKINLRLMLKGTATALGAAGVAAALYVVAGTGYLYFSMVSSSKAVIPLMEKVELQPTKLNSVEIASTHPISQITSWQDSSTREFVYASLPKSQLLGETNEEPNMKRAAVLDKVALIPNMRLPESTLAVAVKYHSAMHSKLVKIDGFKGGLSHPALSNTRYTIQLAASRMKIDMSKLQKKKQLLTKTKIRHFDNGRGSWYILTLGEFNSRNQAQKRAGQLPAELAKLHPWIRPVSNLKQVG